MAGAFTWSGGLALDSNLSALYGYPHRWLTHKRKGFALSDTRPIYQQLALGIRDQIGAGTLAEGERAPSTNELSTFHSVNPTTSAKALTFLADQGLLEKRRGLGMFVVAGAREQIHRERRQALAAAFIRPLLREAAALGLSDRELDELIQAERTTP